MRSHASTIGTEPLTNRVVAVLVTLVFVSVLAVGVAPGVASAAETLERDGGDLIINVSDIEDPKVITVNVTDSDPEISYQKTVTNTTQVRIDVTDPETGTVNGTSLRNATVRVSVENSTENATSQTILENESVPLHALQFAADRPAWIDTTKDSTTDKLRVPLNPAGTVGFDTETTRAEVTIDTDDTDNTTITGTVSEGDTQLVVDRADLPGAVSGSQHPLTLQIPSDAGPVADNPSINPSLRSIGGEFAVWYPLLEAGETHSINAKPSASDARYTGSAVQETNGYLTLPMQPGQTEIKVSANGTTLINRTGTDALAYETPPKIETDLADDGKINFDPSLEGLEIRGAMVTSGNTTTFVDNLNATVIDGQLSLDGVSLSGGETLLLSTTAGDVTVQLQEDKKAAEEPSNKEPSNNGFLDNFVRAMFVLLAPTAVGVVIGTGMSLIATKPLDTVSIFGLLFVGLGFSGGTIFVIDLLSDLISVSQVSFLIAGIGIGFGTLGTAGIPALTAPQKDSESGRGKGSFTTEVTVTDGSRPISGSVTVHYRKSGSQGTVYTKNVRGGTESITMDSGGTWEMWARPRRGSARTDTVDVDPSDPSVELTMPVESSVTVVDAVDGSPIADAAISGEAGISGTTDQNGAVTIDPPEHTTDTEIIISHDRYVGTTEQIQFQQNASSIIELDRRIGRLRGSVRVGGVAAGAVQLQIVPDDGFLQTEFDTETLRTDADGTLAEQEVPIGQYRIVAGITGGDGAYEDTETTVTVSESESVRVEVDARFTWQLDSDHRDRIDRIRQDLRSIPNGGGRDGEIPRYYISVVESMLDVVESVPTAGHKFVGYEIDPTEAVDGILAAADRTTEMVSEAMTTKRNVDLFAACDDMPSTDARWSGSFELTELLDRLETDSNARRREVKQRYEAVDQLIEDRRGRLSEVAPAREVHQRTLDLTRTVSRGPEAVAVGYTSLLLLDAVEELFDHDGLRERLTRTVF